MKLVLILSGIFLAALLLIGAAFFANGHSLRQIKRAFGYPAGQLALNALGDGVWPNGRTSRLADAAHSARHLLVKAGSDSAHMAVCDAASIPIGVCYDAPEAAEESGGVQALGAGPNTVLMVASEAMATAGVPVYAAASGKIALEGVVKVGILRSTASGDGIEVNVEPCAPVVCPNGKTTKAGGTLAVPITRRSVVMTTGGAEALTLADGLPGQRLHLVLGTDGGDGTLTPTTKTGFATIVFADAKDNVDLEFIDATTGWVILGSAGVVAPPVIS